MADFSKIKIGDTSYNVKDAAAWEEIGTKAVAEVSHEATAEEAAEDENIEEGDKIVDTPAAPATGIYKYVDDAVGAGDISIELLAEPTQGSIASYSVKKAGVEISKIEIPVDKVVSSGVLYTATSEDTDLVENNVYVKLIIANSDPIFVPVQGLVDVVSASYDASTETLTLSNIASV